MKTIILFFLGCATIFTANAQTTITPTDKIEMQIIALEQAGWDAWKNNDPEWFKRNTAAEFLNISANGIATREQVIADTPNGCKVNSVSIDNYKFVALTANVVMLTYLAKQDGTCGGVKLPSNLRVTVTYVLREGKWLEACYMETPIGQ